VCVLNQGYKSVIIMGNVAYPWPQEDKHNAQTFPHSIIARVPIGTLDFPPSREAIQWTELSKATTTDTLKFVKDRFPIALRDQCRKAKTPFEQAKILNAWRYAARSTTKGALAEFKDNLEVTHDRDRITWVWNSYDNSASKSRPDWRYVMDEKQYMIVTEFPFKAVSQSHRRRFKDLSDWYGPGKPNPGEFPRNTLVLPAGATLGVLEGRKNVLTWDDVVALTPEPPKEVRAARTAKLAKYVVTHNHKTLEKDVLDPKDGPIIWRRRMDPRSWNNQDHIAAMHPDAQIVKLYERQIDKFCKLHPTAVNLEVHHKTECDKATKALTKDDKDCVGIDNTNGGIWQRLGNIGVLSKVNDPEFKRIAALRGHQAKSKTYQRAKQLGVAPNQPGKVYDSLLAKYPLLSLMRYTEKQHAADIILYINTKYDSTNGGTKKP
jgi:hypothetical protein